jgi:hypothetical protein
MERFYKTIVLVTKGCYSLHITCNNAYLVQYGVTIYVI